MDFTVKQAERHLNELRKARASWVEILQNSNYTSIEALDNLKTIAVKIATIKSLFPNDFDLFESKL